MSNPYKLDQTDELAAAQIVMSLVERFSIPDTERCAAPVHLDRGALTDLSPRERVGILTGKLPVHPETRFALATAGMESRVERQLREMDYQAFLKTPYWAAVRAVMLCRQPHCELCGTRKNRNVHHKTYRHRGSEWRHLEDLAVLCKSCHERVHEAARENG